MLTYKEMRAVLKASPENVKLKYFTKAFYETFCEARKTGNWEPVFATDFYKLEGHSYCVFQELLCASLPRWRLTFIKTDGGWPVDIAQRYVSEDTEEDAKARGMRMLERFGANFVEVMRVA